MTHSELKKHIFERLTYICLNIPGPFALTIITMAKESVLFLEKLAYNNNRNSF